MPTGSPTRSGKSWTTHRSEIRTRCAGVTAPALVVGQEGDPVHRVEVARELAEVLPSAELVVYPDRFALLREIPSLTRRIADFLAG